jgi:hypothetical protein
MILLDTDWRKYPRRDGLPTGFLYGQSGGWTISVASRGPM